MTNETAAHPSSQENTIWLAVNAIESVVIVIINAFTLIVFARDLQLRKRSTYLIINLTVADLLVGAVTGPLEIYYLEGDHGIGFSWQYVSIYIAYNMFPIAFLCNLCLLSLERLHATLYPFNHHLLMEKWFYFKTIICSWLITLLLASAHAFLSLYTLSSSYYLWASSIVLTIVILTVSYVIIIVKVKSSPPPLPGGAVASDRKLSVTVFIVTTVSVLTILPYAIYAAIPSDVRYKLSFLKEFHIELTVIMLYYSCSIVNPRIYAIRMQEFRNAVYKQVICSRTTNSSRVQPIEHHAM